MHNFPEPAVTPPENFAYENRWHAAFNVHYSRAELHGLAKLLETLEGKRKEFATWASSGMRTSYKPEDLADELANPLPLNFFAMAMAQIVNGDESLRQQLREMLVPEINKMVAHHAQLQAEHDATMEATELMQ